MSQLTAPTQGLPETVSAARPASLAHYARWFRKRMLLTLSLASLLTAVLLSLLGPSVFHLNDLAMNTNAVLSPPSARYLMGTDEYGRSVFARVVFGIRLSLSVGIAVALVTGCIGTSLGLLAAWYRSLDTVVMRLMDGLMAFPSILLALALMAVIGPGTVNTVVVLSVVFLPATVRVVRASAMTVAQMEYIVAARAAGASTPRLLVLHVLPNIVTPVLVQQTFTLAWAILGEATLSFVGAGTPPPTPSLGNILSEAQNLLYQAEWLALYPGLAIAWLVLSVNLVGDGLRDLFGQGS